MPVTENDSLGLVAFARRDSRPGDIIPQALPSLRIVHVIEPQPPTSGGLEV
jgi:hypothetical protein